AARTQEGQQLPQVIDVALLVRIDEGHVHGGLHGGQLLVGITFDDRHQRLHPRLLEVLAGGGRPAGVDLEGDEPAARVLEGQAEPEAGVSRGRPDLDHRLRRRRLGEQTQRAAVFRRHAQVRSPAFAHLFEDGEGPLLSLPARRACARRRQRHAGHREGHDRSSHRLVLHAGEDTLDLLWPGTGEAWRRAIPGAVHPAGPSCAAWAWPEPGSSFRAARGRRRGRSSRRCPPRRAASPSCTTTRCLRSGTCRRPSARAARSSTTTTTAGWTSTWSTAAPATSTSRRRRSATRSTGTTATGRSPTSPRRPGSRAAPSAWASRSGTTTTTATW